MRTTIRLTGLAALIAALLVGGGSASAAFPGANGKIVFVHKSATTHGDLYVMNADGSEPMQLTDNGPAAADENPRYSPDGSRIAFEHLNLMTSPNESTINVVNADGSGRVALRGDGGLGLSWSPDGNRLVFVSAPIGANARLFTMAVDGTDSTPLTSPPDSSPGGDINPAWSPDGTKIAFVRINDCERGDLYVVGIDGMGEQQLVDGGCTGARTPSWSPDGTRIAFVIGSSIKLIALDGTGLSTLRSGSDPAWSPDGTKIVFVNAGISVVGVDGTGLVQLTTALGDQRPDWGASTASVNRAPVCSDTTLTTHEGVAGTTEPVCSDADNDPLTYSIDSQGTKGTASVSAGQLRFVPNPGQTGADSFTYKANDGVLESAPATVAVTIEPNQAPVCANTSLVTPEAVPGTTTPVCTDADGDPLAYSIVSQGTKGTASVVAGLLRYAPNPGQTGSDSFTYKASDGVLDSNSATVTVTITPFEHAPVCADTTLTTLEDTAGDTPPVCSDLNGDALTYSIVSQGTNGTASVANGLLHYVPGSGQTGSDSFTYRANDGTLASNVATVAVTIRPSMDLAVDIKVRRHVPSGHRFTYRLTVRNLGPSAAPNVVLADGFPPSLTILAVAFHEPMTCATTENLLGCSLASLPPGGSATVDVIVQAGIHGPVIDSASVESLPFAGVVDSNLSNNVDTALTIVH